MGWNEFSQIQRQLKPWFASQWEKHQLHCNETCRMGNTIDWWLSLENSLSWELIPLVLPFFPGWYLSNTIQSDILTLWFYINTVILHFQVVIMLLSKWESDCEWRKQCLTLSSRSCVCSFIICLLSSCFKVFGYLIFNFPSRKMCACVSVLCCFKWSPHKKSI